MLETVFSSLYNCGTESVTVSVFLLLSAAALALGLLHAFAYGKNNPSSKSFAVTLATLPVIVSTVILMVNGSIGAGVAVAGAFSLVRFRSAPGTGKEITAVFASMAIGLACGMGCPGLAALFCFIMCLTELLYSKSRFGENKELELKKVLHVTLPESLEYADIFDDIFEEYTTDSRMFRVKTSNLGSLNRISYEIRLRRKGTEKQLIDAIRCRNGNLEVSLTAQADEANDL